MNDSLLTLEQVDNGVVIAVKVQARARRNGIANVIDGMLRVQVTAAPEKGRANVAVMAVIAKAVNVPKSSVTIISGAASPRKRLLVQGLDAATIRAKLCAILPE